MYGIELLKETRNECYSVNFDILVVGVNFLNFSIFYDFSIFAYLSGINKLLKK